MLLRLTVSKSLVITALLLYGAGACRSTVPDPPTTRPAESRADPVDADLGVPYSVVVQEIRNTYDLALAEIRGAWTSLPIDANEKYRRNEFPHASELLESAIKRVNDHEVLRSKAWKVWPSLFVDLAYLRSKAEDGLVQIAFANLVEPGGPDVFTMHLNRLITMSEPTLEIISQKLQSKSPDNADTAAVMARFREYEEELAGFVAKAYLLLGAESKRAGDIAGARVHWERSLKFARSNMLKSQIEQLLHESTPLTGH